MAAMLRADFHPAMYTCNSDGFAHTLELYVIAGLNRLWIPFGCCNPEGYVHFPVLFLQRINVADPVGSPPYPESSA